MPLKINRNPAGRYFHIDVDKTMECPYCGRDWQGEEIIPRHWQKWFKKTHYSALLRGDTIIPLITGDYASVPTVMCPRCNCLWSAITGRSIYFIGDDGIMTIRRDLLKREVGL